MKLKFWERFGKPEAVQTYGSALLSERSSSPVSEGTPYTGQIYPKPAFSDRLEAYDTVGKIYAAVEGYCKGINKRDFYFANVDEENADERGIKLMEEWEQVYHGSVLIDCLCHDLLIFGNAIIATTDWLPVQMTSVKYMKKLNRKPSLIMLSIDGREIPLGSIYNPASNTFTESIPLEDYVHIKYIDVAQQTWGRGLYHAITTTFIDNDGREATPLYRVVRQLQQDGAKIYHRLAAPRSIWGFPGILNKDEYDVNNPNSLAYRLKNALPGDRVMVQSEVTVAAEPIDGKSRFTEIKQDIMDEVEVTTQSSASRLITKPSAMADAREANEKDDDTLLNLMEIIRRCMDEYVIPRVLGSSGIDPESIEFRWGKEDDFEFEFADIVQMAALQVGGKPVVSVEEVRDMLKKTGTPLDDAKFKAFEAEAEARRQEQMQMMSENAEKKDFPPKKPFLPKD